MTKSKIIIYTDGSSRGNPGRGGWGVIIADEDRVVELGGYEAMTTNNRMELRAAIEGLKVINNGQWIIRTKFPISSEMTNDEKDLKTIEVRPDSQYVIKGITEWILGWKRNGWVNSKREPVLNRDLWEALDEAVSKIHNNGTKTSWCYTPGHKGIPGNERADEIATGYADGKPPKLFDDVRGKYAIDLDQIKPSSVSNKQKKIPEEKTRQKMKA